MVLALEAPMAMRWLTWVGEWCRSLAGIPTLWEIYLLFVCFYNHFSTQRILAVSSVSWCLWRSNVSQKGCSCPCPRLLLMFPHIELPSTQASTEVRLCCLSCLSCPCGWKAHEFIRTWFSGYHHNWSLFSSGSDTFWDVKPTSKPLEHVFVLQRGDLHPTGASAHMPLGLENNMGEPKVETSRTDRVYSPPNWHDSPGAM